MRTVGPGVFVLGMHRSGTSVVAGVLDRLGLEGGPRASMLSADEFNSDGYWEQRPVVEWHDRVMAHLRSWASAPAPADPAAVRALASRVGGDAEDLLAQLYTDGWFLKDPRQCLLMPLWEEVRGHQDLPIVVFRHPAGVLRSLSRRNVYSPQLAAALWERYSRDALLGVSGRRCVVLRYEDLLDDPVRQTHLLAEATSVHFGSPAEEATVEHAAALVRSGRADGREADVDLSPEQQELLGVLLDLRGFHHGLDLPDLPPASEQGAALVERRRRRLNAVRPLIRMSSSARARLDRVPAILHGR